MSNTSCYNFGANAF